MITRAQDFRTIRRILGNPKAQRPSPHDIVDVMLAAEQFMLNQAQGINQGVWSIGTVSVTSVVDQAEYTLTPEAGSTFGKALFVYRELDDNGILPITMTDFLSETGDQSYEFWMAPFPLGQTGIIGNISGEKIAFYRDDGVIKMRIYPTPEQSHVYKVKYASGRLDWSTFAWTDVSSFPEHSDYRQYFAASMISDIEWEGLDFDQNERRMARIQNQIEKKLAFFGAEWIPFCRTVQNSAKVSESGYFWEK